MIVGVVDNREATVDIDIADSAGQWRLIATVVDTGFNGHLTLSASKIADLDLPLVGKRLAWLADGSEVELEIYAATIRWHGRQRSIVVSRAEGGPLLGMALLADNRLTIDVINGGQVMIESLPGEDA